MIAVTTSNNNNNNNSKNINLNNKHKKEQPVHKKSKRSSKMSDSGSEDEHSVDGVGAIVPIQQQDVHRIVSGQVISDMASAVKELVDNALDAGATSINIRLFNQGMDVIEVSDDGRGIPKHSRPLIAMKHATSKIFSFDDLFKDVIMNGQMQPNQLGFRGEALFSLTQMSQALIVCTRTEQEEMAQQLQFSRDGYLDPNSTKDVARKVGTTVAVVKLFDKLPVRRADMIKRLKVQRAKLFRLMQAYAVLCVGVRINVYDKLGPAYSNTVVKMSTTEKSKSIKETISSVFGSQFLSGLCMIRVDLAPILKKVLEGRTDTSVLQESENLWRIEGMISNAPNYNQRNIAREIQFFSVNGRPVDLPKVSKLLSEVWTNFNSNEGTKRRPACMLCLYLPNSMFDVNIAPDKREVFIANDNEIYEIVRQELHKVWSLQTEGTFVANLVEKESNSNTTNRQVENPYTDSKNMPTPSCHGTNRPHEEIGRESSVAVAVAPTASGRRMMRRNAFINRFDNIGKATTDFHHAKIKDISLQNDDNVDKLDATFAHNNSDGQRTNESRIESPVLKKLRHHNDDSSPDRRNSSPDKRIWAQARLSFLVRESRSQVEDILQLKSMETNANIDDRNNQTSERYKHAESNQSATSSKPQSIGDGKNTLSKSQHSTRHVSQEEIIIKNQTQKMDDGSKDEKSQNATRYVSQDQIVVAAKSSIYNDRPQPQAANVADTTSMKDEMPSNFEEGTHLKKRPLISTIQSNSSTETINPHDSKMIPTPSCHGTKRPHEEIGHESSVAVAPTASGRQMMRRNAFINRFDNVGEATTDFHHTKSMKDRMPSNFEKGTHLKNRPLNVTIQSNSSTETINPRDLHSKSDQSATKKVAYSSTTAESDSIIMEECDEENEEKNECDDKVKEESSNDDLDKEKGHRIVVWDAFQSTAAVIEQADVARINKMKRCEKLKEMKVSRSKVNNDTEQDENNKGNVVKLSKEEFLTMTIVGQFNRGFILALCEKGQLWILDQHACDEQYNFERLCRETKIHEQKLIQPLPLELSPSEENCVLDNMDIFEKNGFRFHYDATKPPRNRLSLTALPHSGSGGKGPKAVQFGKEDVGALCAILGADGGSSNALAGSGTGADGRGVMGNNAVRRHASVGNGEIIRLPKSIAMFASRACRSSIMIGEALSEKKMKEVIKKMCGVDQPWTCPHGRPTIRHIRDLLDTFLQDEMKS